MDDVDLVRDWVRKQLPSLPDRVTRPTVYLDVPREPARAARCAKAGRRVLLGEGTGKVAVLMLAGGLSTRWGRAGLAGTSRSVPSATIRSFGCMGHGSRP